uniref:Polyprotein, putative n=1 Tax=Solanum demissum TaxID=50514 RepID=Q6L3J9_SOLDE|nr:Polyprotein, putative [Solanum demissum]
MSKNDIVLINETRGGVNDRQEIWRSTLDSKGLTLSKTKTEYMECKFSVASEKANRKVRIDTQLIPKKGSFKVIIRQTMLYEVECLSVQNSYVQQMKVAEMRMFRWMCRQTRKDKIGNKDIWSKVGITVVVDKMREARLK